MSADSGLKPAVQMKPCTGATQNRDRGLKPPVQEFPEERWGVKGIYSPFTVNSTPSVRPNTSGK